MTVVNLDRSLNDEIDDAVRAVMLAVKELKSYRHLKARDILRSQTNMRDIELARRRAAAEVRP